MSGHCDPRFAEVREQFERNFEAGLEVGAAFAAYHRGEKVVDLWGGVADDSSGRAWAEDTLQLVYSSTKGATAICANQLVEQGKLDIEAPVAEYWPEFADGGKETMPVRLLLTHQAGLAWVDEELSLDDVLAWDPIVAALARQKPLWEPGSAHGYHAVTYGNLVGEVVRRITGRSLGTYFRDEVAEPLGLDFWIGLPAELEPRVAMLVGNLGVAPGDAADEATRAVIDQFMGPESMLGRALTVNGAFTRDDDPAAGNVFNSRRVHAAELPAANGICDARSLARMYAACIGEVDGVRVLGEAQMRDAATQRTSGPNIVLLDMDLQFGLGFFVPSSLMNVGGPGSFGHAGAGGSLGWADPDAGFAFGYVMNKMATTIAEDVRSSSLINACYAAVAS
ncbi:MAG: beta-lactamase family protein [Acidimicrobiia bacterium]|nr:beta-lactamase family protein [Acidimicrobiia bacterium]